MATREELGLHIGDIALWCNARLTKVELLDSDSRYTTTYPVSLDTPGAKIVVAAVKYVSFGEKMDRVQVRGLYSENRNFRLPLGVERDMARDSASLLRIDRSGDEILNHGLFSTGILIQEKKDPNHGIIYSISRNDHLQSDNQAGEVTITDSLRIPNSGLIRLKMKQLFARFRQ